MQNVTAQQQQSPSTAELKGQLREQIRDQVLRQVQSAQKHAEAQAGAATPPPPPPGAPAVLVPPGPPFTGPDMIPPQAVDIVFAFFAMVVLIVVGLPIARAIARRMDRKPIPAPAEAAIASQLQRIEHTVESMAIEVERISEAQRYMARLQTERAEPLAAVPPPRQTTP